MTDMYTYVCMLYLSMWKTQKIQSYKGYNTEYPQQLQKYKLTIYSPHNLGANLSRMHVLAQRLFEKLI